MKEASTKDEQNGGMTCETEPNAEMPYDTEPSTSSQCGSVSKDSEPVNAVFANFRKLYCSFFNGNLKIFLGICN